MPYFFCTVSSTQTLFTKLLKCKNGDCSVSCGADRTFPTCSNTPVKPSKLVKFPRLALMSATNCPTFELAPNEPAGSMINETLRGAWYACSCAEGAELLSATMPLNTADHAARSGRSFAPRLTDNCPRVALSFRAVLKLSNNKWSVTGTEFSASKVSESPVNFFQVVTPSAPLVAQAKIFVALRYTVCHGVPRCTRPSQPTVGSLSAGKSQLSEYHTSGSL